MDSSPSSPFISIDVSRVPDERILSAVIRWKKNATLFPRTRSNAPDSLLNREHRNFSVNLVPRKEEIDWVSEASKWSSPKDVGVIETLVAAVTNSRCYWIKLFARRMEQRVRVHRCPIGELKIAKEGRIWQRFEVVPAPSWLPTPEGPLTDSEITSTCFQTTPSTFEHFFHDR